MQYAFLMPTAWASDQAKAQLQRPAASVMAVEFNLYEGLRRWSYQLYGDHAMGVECWNQNCQARWRYGKHVPVEQHKLSPQVTLYWYNKQQYFSNTLRFQCCDLAADDALGHGQLMD